jgi:hypothetical protein
VATPSFVLKLERADDHLKTLIEEVRWWVQSDAYRISEEIDPKTDLTTVYVEPVSQPPLKLSILMGDALHNLRGSLDHLALALAEANLGQRPSKEVEEGSQFPIYSDPGRWKGGHERRIGSAHPDAQAIIERLQPYQAGEQWESHPLWILRQLSDFDKHRRLPIVGTYARLGPSQVAGPNAYIEYLQLHAAGGPLERKTPLITWGGIRDPMTGAEVKVDYSVAMHIAFSEADPKPDAPIDGKEVLEVLFGIRDFIAFQVVPNLESFARASTAKGHFPS